MEPFKMARYVPHDPSLYCVKETLLGFPVEKDKEKKSKKIKQVFTDHVLEAICPLKDSVTAKRFLKILLQDTLAKEEGSDEEEKNDFQNSRIRHFKDYAPKDNRTGELFVKKSRWDTPSISKGMGRGSKDKNKKRKRT